MKITPAPSQDYRVTSPYVGPSHGHGRMGLLTYFSKKAAMVRPFHTAAEGQPPIQRSERGEWELGWIELTMTPRGPEAFLFAAFKRARDRWKANGCPSHPKPWEFIEASR